jgi:hypothetical protein
MMDTIYLMKIASAARAAVKMAAAPQSLLRKAAPYLASAAGGAVLVNKGQKALEDLRMGRAMRLQQPEQE